MEPILKHVDSALISNTKPFMYTEFPHKRNWSTAFGDLEYRQVLRTLPANAPCMLYVHIPFCEELCWFCTCWMFITRDDKRIRKYLNSLIKEIELLRIFFEENGLTPDFREIHLGGGSPTILNEAEFNELTAHLGTIVNLGNLSEFAMEIDPRRVDQARMKYYYSKGINRISFGVQDLDYTVQTAINRVQPPELTENLLAPEIRQLFGHGVNIDLICGLPHQTETSIRATCLRVAQMAPDRICLNYLHYAEGNVKHQRLMADGKQGRPDRLPDGYERKQLFLAAMDILLQNGYIRTGYDHFVLPSDPVAKAMAEGKMNWNALGVTAGRYMDVIGVGVSSMSNISNCYAQNVFKEEEYGQLLAAGKFPVLRGHCLSQDDVIRREVIQKIRTYFYLDFVEIERKYGIDSFPVYFKKEIARLQPFVSDGLVELTDGNLTVTDTGQQFANVICSCFDSYFVSPPPPASK